MEALSYLVPDDCPGDSVILMIVAFLHRPLSHVVERHYVMQHGHGLVEGAVAVILGVGVLLKEVILDQLSYLQSDLV